MVVERHRLDAELLAELAHAERLEAALIGEPEGGLQDELARQRDARANSLRGVPCAAFDVCVISVVCSVGVDPEIRG